MSAQPATNPQDVADSRGARLKNLATAVSCVFMPSLGEFGFF